MTPLLDFIVTVNDNGELKTLRPTDFNTATQALLHKLVNEALNRQSAKGVKRRRKRDDDDDEDEYWSTATNAPPGVEG